MGDEVLEQLQQIKIRIDKLEAAIFGNRCQEKTTTSNKTEKYVGAKGGILLLIQKGFLNTIRTASDIKKELEKEGYVYKRQVIQTALNRLSASKGDLVKIDDGGKKAYVKRK